MTVNATSIDFDSPKQADEGEVRRIYALNEDTYIVNDHSNDQDVTDESASVDGDMEDDEDDRFIIEGRRLLKPTKLDQQSDVDLDTSGGGHSFYTKDGTSFGKNNLLPSACEVTDSDPFQLTNQSYDELQTPTLEQKPRLMSTHMGRTMPRFRDVLSGQMQLQQKHVTNQSSNFYDQELSKSMMMKPKE